MLIDWFARGIAVAGVLLTIYTIWRGRLKDSPSLQFSYEFTEWTPGNLSLFIKLVNSGHVPVSIAAVNMILRNPSKRHVPIFNDSFCVTILQQKNPLGPGAVTSPAMCPTAEMPNLFQVTGIYAVTATGKRFRLPRRDLRNIKMQVRLALLQQS